MENKDILNQTKNNESVEIFNSGDEEKKQSKKHKKQSMILDRNNVLIIILICFLVSSLTGFLGGALAYKLAKLGDGFSPDTMFNFLLNSKKNRTGENNINEIDKIQDADKLSNKTPDKYIPAETREEQIINVVKNTSGSVVSIIVSKDLPILEKQNVNPFEDFFNNGGDPFKDFFSPFQFQVPQYKQNGTEKKEVGGGTGFVVSSKNGYILTNKHVVDIDDAEYTVLTNDGSKYPATVVARDPVQDIAVLKIEKTDLPELNLGDSDAIQQGQTVIAIGNALGEFRNTVNVGVISGLRRTITAGGQFSGQSEVLEEVIQTDAAINPGNSGGPLLNLRGEVIGINTAIAVGAQNIGFSIPINKAKKDLEQVKSGGKISTVFLGIRFIVINSDIQKNNNLEVDYGALVARGETMNDIAVTPGSPADKAGIVENDIILEIDGQKLTEDTNLRKIIQNHSVGDEITLKVFHKGETKEVRVVLDERK